MRKNPADPVIQGGGRRRTSPCKQGVRKMAALVFLKSLMVLATAAAVLWSSRELKPATRRVLAGVR